MSIGVHRRPSASIGVHRRPSASIGVHRRFKSLPLCAPPRPQRLCGSISYLSQIRVHRRFILLPSYLASSVFLSLFSVFNFDPALRQSPTGSRLRLSLCRSAPFNFQLYSSPSAILAKEPRGSPLIFRLLSCRLLSSSAFSPSIIPAII